MNLSVAHVANYYRRYPGETVTFYTRVTALKLLEGFTLRISLPHGLTVKDYRAPAAGKQELPALEVGGESNYLVWQVAEEIPAGTDYEYETEARVVSTCDDLFLESQAMVSPGIESAPVAAEETTGIAVKAAGSYLDYLPGMYQKDELMGRFLMLFESYWRPIEGQIDNISLYFDPEMTTPDFLPWLASWIGLVLDEHWPEARRRQLLGAAASLYRKRGTKQGLREYLEIYTGRRPKIIEHRAHDFRLGAEARLGPGIALGRINKPHTFTVILTLPSLTAGDENERSRGELVQRRTIEAIIEAEKPAHTSYRLQLEREER